MKYLDMVLAGILAGLLAYIVWEGPSVGCPFAIHTIVATELCLEMAQCDIDYDIIYDYSYAKDFLEQKCNEMD